MIIENQNNIKKQYRSPRLEVIMLDNHIALDAPSDGPPLDPFNMVDRNEASSKKVFPDAPASEDPFGGSSPNYK